MNKPVYTDVKANPEFDGFQFISTGPRGDIPKLVRFYELSGEQQLFQLALLDVLNDGSTSDTQESNNDDMRKVLATVVAIIREYTRRFPDRYILFWGSTAQRQQAYHRILSLYTDELSQDFELFGVFDDSGYEMFNPHRAYGKYLVKRK